jgi:hypothetical protein
MSFGADGPPSFRHGAKFVPRILEGKQPKDIPVEQPTKFELGQDCKGHRSECPRQISAACGRHHRVSRCPLLAISGHLFSQRHSGSRADSSTCRLLIQSGRCRGGNLKRQALVTGQGVGGRK